MDDARNAFAQPTNDNKEEALLKLIECRDHVANLPESEFVAYLIEMSILAIATPGGDC